MRGISPFGLWTCAALYAAAGVFGLFFLTSQPNAVPTTDGYGVIRIVLENVRNPDDGMPDFPLGLTMGMILSVPMIVGGLGLLWWAFRGAKPPSAAPQGA